jgi:hypothetical protein
MEGFDFWRSDASNTNGFLYFTTQDEQQQDMMLTQLKTAGAPGPGMLKYEASACMNLQNHTAVQKMYLPISRSCQECAATDRFERVDMIRSFSRGWPCFSSAMLLQREKDHNESPCMERAYVQEFCGSTCSKSLTKILGLHNNSQKMHLPRVFAIYQI